MHRASSSRTIPKPGVDRPTGEDNIGPGLEADADDTDYDMERVTDKDNKSRK